ncbi:phospholipase Plb5 [Schizosaccharomyces pombe]|uniref:Probable lysophospholipase 5 n=1 Tax=Schizosaccharomyces pombe (strain 972 / ATCC 24843) TaxID=284812 RepID=PLB5_SCHPO|nr:putative phospholipase [Schizosaccharomyces pombe]Q9Y7N6.3 RecName: Full=Putative lysophospholipase C1450.09c; AltName: Full=Phospholipase B; Flags: Precursor [Schizosaccharomyces pombe 972h-]CAB40176.3 phospholipase (predicted) [Schizosaccharomyces pombe]|eukprot:NP_001342884.1 putative phospholipase [Schizosaccharomyces pombe]
MKLSSFGLFLALQLLPALGLPSRIDEVDVSDPELIGLLKPDNVDKPANSIPLSKRSTSPSYAPYTVACPSGSLLRPASDGLSTGEQEFVDKRVSKVNSALESFISKTGLKIDTKSVLNDTDGPRLGIAISGGGFPAMLTGAGAINAFDARNGNTTSLGGILQSSMYLTGLSGGSWLVGSVAVNNFANITFLHDDVWNLDHSLFAPYDDAFENFYIYQEWFEQVLQKKNAGFNVSITDLWGRALALKLVNPLTGGANTTFSSVTNETWFQDGEFPFPIIIADNVIEGETVIPLNDTVFEFTPIEFGTWDTGVESFIPMEYTGTHLINGIPLNESCVRNFDNAGFLMGTSSNVFSGILPATNASLTASNNTFNNAVLSFLEMLAEDQLDVGLYPNPYQGYGNASNTTTTNPLEPYPIIELIDGGSDSEGIPFWPLLHPQRDVDVIFAIDGGYQSATSGWPDGSSLVSTYERVLATNSSGVRGFPYIPDTNTFLALGLNTHPTFFGCDGRNTTAGNHTVNDDTPPLVVYFPNYPWTMYANVTTYTVQLEDTLSSGMIENAAVAATQNNSDSFAVCVACALVQRSLERKNMSTPSQCASCFNQYCWNGTIASTTVTTYAPTVLSAKI